MVDAWTQWLLAPLHEWIFLILRKISIVDGTFNQQAPLQRLQRKFYPDKVKRTFASIDLSAATDRLPISMQKILLEKILQGVVPDPKAFASCWVDLLVGREYEVSLSKKLEKETHVPKDLPKDVKYAVGQPMGALSS
jgi:hypothetical protein